MECLPDIKTLGTEVSRLKRTQPELFDYLADRDDRLVDAIIHLASRISRPDDLPELHLPFPDLFETRSCREIGQDLNLVGEELEIELPPIFNEMLQRAAWLCENGIRLRKTRLRELLGNDSPSGDKRLSF